MQADGGLRARSLGRTDRQRFRVIRIRHDLVSDGDRSGSEVDIGPSDSGDLTGSGPGVRQNAKELRSSPLTVENHRGDQVPHPLLTESRQQSIVLTRLLASIRLPSGDEADLHRPQRRGASRGSYGIRGVL